MSIALMTDVWKLDLQASRKMVLLALADNANDEGTNCFPSISTIVEKCSMSERSVFGHLAALEEDGLIRRQERPGRSSNYFINAEAIRELVVAKRIKVLEAQEAKSKSNVDSPKVIHQPAPLPTPAKSAGVPANPHSINTPVESAGVQNLHPPLQNLQGTPAESAPITTTDPFPIHNNNNEPEEAGSGCCGDLASASKEQLHWPICTPEEKNALNGLLAALPAEQHQVLLDEVEGSRRAGLIRTNPVSYAGGLVRAMLAGSFTVGHSASVAAKRQNTTLQPAKAVTFTLPEITPEDISRGQEFMDRIRTANAS